jgi:hypothetical protein
MALSSALRIRTTVGVQSRAVETRFSGAAWFRVAAPLVP